PGPGCAGRLDAPPFHGRPAIARGLLEHLGIQWTAQSARAVLEDQPPRGVGGGAIDDLAALVEGAEAIAGDRVVDRLLTAAAERGSEGGGDEPGPDHGRNPRAPEPRPRHASERTSS